jgi:hypothetical protein
MQFIVISLKTGFFQGSEALVGVYRDQGANSSKVLTLDVSPLLPSGYPPNGPGTVADTFGYSCANTPRRYINDPPDRQSAWLDTGGICCADQRWKAGWVYCR